MLLLAHPHRPGDDPVRRGGRRRPVHGLAGGDPGRAWRWPRGRPAPGHPGGGGGDGRLQRQPPAAHPRRRRSGGQPGRAWSTAGCGCCASTRGPRRPRAGPRGTLGGRPLPQTDPLALLFSYPCHATVLARPNLLYSADYPGGAALGRGGRSRGGLRTTRGGRGPCSSPAASATCARTCCAPDGRRGEGALREGSDRELSVLGRRLGSEVVRVAEGWWGSRCEIAAGRGEV